MSDKDIKNNYYIKRVKCNITVIHSKNDDILPYENGKLLFDNAGIKHLDCNISKTFIEIDGPHSNPVFNNQNLFDLFESIGIHDQNVVNQKTVNELKDIINIDSLFK